MDGKVTFRSAHYLRPACASPALLLQNQPIRNELEYAKYQFYGPKVFEHSSIGLEDFK